MNKRACIVVPIYKEKMTDGEKKSFHQVFNILGEFDIYLVCPETLNVENYIKETTSKKVKVKYFDKKYFNGLIGYNRLMVNIYFYKSFEMFEYILIYQLDAFVFRDDLIFWCEQKYDYIGAPWFKGTKMRRLSGNGGFSLRNTKSFIIALSNPIIKIIGNIFINIMKKNEDFFWAYIAFIFKKNKVAESRAAIDFSFERDAELLYSINKRLPFGCHGWNKYSMEFWNKNM